MIPRTIALAAGLALLLLAARPALADEAPCAPAAAPPTVTILRVQDPVTPGQDDTRPRAGQRFVAVLLEVTAASDASARYNPLNVTVKDAEGYEYDDTETNAAGPALLSGTLAPGESVRGWVTIEVGAEARLVRLDYDAGGFVTLHLPLAPP